MASSNKRPHLSAQAYWGFDNSKLNTENFDDYTIVRVFERGTSQDVNEIFECYGSRVKTVILGTKVLPQRAIRVAETIWPGFSKLRDRSSRTASARGRRIKKQPSRSDAGQLVCVARHSM